MNRGKLTIIYGCMFAGKTSKLIEVVNFLLESGKKIAVFHPVIDTRYKLNAIATHDGDSLISTALDLNSESVPIDGFDTAVIDEVHFFNNRVLLAIRSLQDQGIDVITAGLDKNYLGEPFEVTQELIKQADTKLKLFAKCTVCGQPAEYTYRLTKESALIVIGGAGTYEARCEIHFKEGEASKRKANQQ